MAVRKPPPSEKRREQNRINQRKFRERQKLGMTPGNTQPTTRRGRRTCQKTSTTLKSPDASKDQTPTTTRGAEEATTAENGPSPAPAPREGSKAREEKGESNGGTPEQELLRSVVEKINKVYGVVFPAEHSQQQQPSQTLNIRPSPFDPGYAVYERIPDASAEYRINTLRGMVSYMTDFNGRMEIV